MKSLFADEDTVIEEDCDERECEEFSTLELVSNTNN